MKGSHQEIAMKKRFLVTGPGLKMSCTTLVALTVFAGLVGCTAPPTSPLSTSPVAGPDGAFTITRKGESYYAQPSQLTAMATQDAQAHCLKMGKKFKEIRSRELPTRAGYVPQSELLYRCD